ncbi:Coenzyme F420 hydrogenase/dehydrogenase, beta subunit C-terminal domain [Methanothermobacter wolfeii]|uniref:Coenzyme F420 hydrogenase/dehydrogenase, beta subunit C-terminal domain n=1 Tax=Methanothermobacter wolfeii TaxID=145261 RepID=A0ABU8TWC0_METWO|nr:Coenzyme F420 hydrogenase subunit beta [Methanothermobacter wolfeii]
MKNIGEIRDLCTGCGTCAAMCPREIIEMNVNRKKGIYEPIIVGECDECGVCIKVCPGVSVDFRELNREIFGYEGEDMLLGNHEACYVAHSTDEKLRYNASSGGMVTQILIHLIDKGIVDGALVTRMNPEKPLEPEPFIARTPEDIIEAAGSKYCPVPANIALREILREPGKYAVVGLPCHIQGIRKAEMINRKLRERIVYHLGIVCNHTPSFMATEFLLKRLGVRREEVTGIRYRGDGWPGSLKVETVSGDILLLPEYWGSGFGQLFKPSRCRRCCDHMAELSDMSFADPWLREFEGEKKGKTLIVLRKGLGILDELKDEGLCQLQPLEPDKVLTSQLYNIYMKKKIYMIDNELYKGRFPRIDFIDRLISLFEPEKLKIPEKLMLKYVILYSILVSLKARRDFLR